MKIGLYALSLFCLLFSSCDEDKSINETVETESKSQKPVISVKAIEALNYTDYALSTESKEAITEWENYKELEAQIGYLKKADLSFFNGDKKELRQFISDFKTSTPKQFLINPVISRTAIIETTLLKLNENLTLENIEEKDKLESIREVFVAFSNLNYQINKKLENDFYNKIQPE